MSSQQYTLEQFFDFTEKSIAPEKLSVIDSSDAVSGIREKMSKAHTVAKLPAVRNETVKKIGDLLNISLPHIMVGAWNKHRMLVKYSDKERYGTDETIMAPLTEHTIKSVHKPYLEIYINDTLVGKVDFSVTVALTIKGLTLKIRNGKIMEILAGSCVGKGTIKCEGIVILEKKSQAIPLPGSIKLGEGIPVMT
jgi:hypothetical protein